MNLNNKPNCAGPNCWLCKHSCTITEAMSESYCILYNMFTWTDEDEYYLALEEHVDRVALDQVTRLQMLDNAINTMDYATIQELTQE